MNHNIEEIAIRYGFKYHEMVGIGWASNDKDGLNKFAQAIIKECATIAASVPAPYSGKHYESDCHAWDNACTEASNRIRKHFGI
jgi:hypothetical protein